jgi:hypothetical protein
VCWADGDEAEEGDVKDDLEAMERRVRDRRGTGRGARAGWRWLWMELSRRSACEDGGKQNAQSVGGKLDADMDAVTSCECLDQALFVRRGGGYKKVLQR